MQIQLTPKEEDFLRHLLQERHRELVREISHTDHQEFRHVLKEHEKTIEALMSKLGVSVFAGE